MIKISFIIGYSSQMLPLLRKILKEESENFGFCYHIFSPRNINSAVVEKSDCVFIYAAELPHDLKLEDVKLVISISEETSHVNKAPSDVIHKASVFFKVGGEKNLRNLVRLILKTLGFEVDVGEVEEVPWHAIFHPRLGLFTSLEDYLKAYNRRPLVGILIHRNNWLYDNLKPLEAIVEALEHEGLGVLPVFTYGLRDPILNTPSKVDTIKTFFLRDGRPVVDAVINLTYFFLIDHGDEKLLKTLNVPIIQPCFSSSQSILEWSENPQGLDYMSQVWTVIMPEVDGLIEPIYVAGSRMVDGAKIFEPYGEHARYLAKRVKRWIEFRRKKPEERRIAIVLINPPCKGLEASVAIGAGLDVPESIARLLNRLKEDGYRVENPPKNGKELIRLILERKAISEFRWTSVEEIVARGGALDFVDLETYLSWFNELPQKAREEMIEEWGYPEEFLSKNTGMVYNGKFVIPGLSFGNVVLIPQPKFGCAGARCDGRVCKILHNPKIPPPHQWLAVYRWITRKFKADLIVHFGTHGSLEFRPGKGVGLSVNCWPEISIDDVPHVYVYNVSNPMEGVIAKRRSYAVVVDHIHPPMAMAEVLDEIDSLLAQYSKAKQLGDFERAKIIYKDLIEKARRNNIPIKAKEPEKVVEEIHRYVDAVRNTQIEMGLHVFAHPRLDKLAEYVATIMANDTHEYPSIRRVIAEYLGLDYDEIRSKPNEINRLGLTNSETLKLLHKIAVKTIDDLLRVGSHSDEVILEILDKNISDILGGAVYA